MAKDTLANHKNPLVKWMVSQKVYNYYLVGGLEHVLFFHILGISSSELTQLTFIFFRGVGQPPTTSSEFP